MCLNKPTACTYEWFMLKEALLFNLISDFVTFHLGFTFTITNISFWGIWFCKAPSVTWTSCSHVLFLVSNLSVHQNYLEHWKEQTLGPHLWRLWFRSDIGPLACISNNPQAVLLLLFHRTLSNRSRGCLSGGWLYMALETYTTFFFEELQGYPNKFHSIINPPYFICLFQMNSLKLMKFLLLS